MVFSHSVLNQKSFMSARKANKNNVASERIFLTCTVFYGEVQDMSCCTFNLPSSPFLLIGEQQSHATCTPPWGEPRVFHKSRPLGNGSRICESQNSDRSMCLCSVKLSLIKQGIYWTGE